MNCQIKYHCSPLKVKGEVRFIAPDNFLDQGAKEYAKALTARALLQNALIKELRYAAKNLER